MTALKYKVEIPLSVPVVVIAADGGKAERSTLTMHRPKVRHAKRLAALIGQDLLDILTNDEKSVEQDSQQMGKLLIGKLLADDHLEGLTEIIADLCGEGKATIDDVDLADLIAIGMAFAGFFPALQSVMSGLSGATSSPSES